MKTIYLSMLFIMAFSGAVAQSIFENPITGTNPNTANPYTAGQIVNAGITVSGIGRGTGITGSNTNNRYNATGWNSASFDANDYFEFTLTPNSGAAISFISAGITLQNSATGPLANWVLRSSKDGFSSDIGSLSSNSTGILNSVDLSAPAFQNINTAITFRIYAWGASSGTGTFSVNDFVFNGITGVLPVQLEYFKAAKVNNANSIQWKASCSNPAGASFSLQQSGDGINFFTIYFISASALQCQQPFVVTDKNPLRGKNYYRLLLTEDITPAVLSNVILLQDNSNTGIRLFPSTVVNTANLNITAIQKSQVHIVITDMAGRKLQIKNIPLTSGDNSIVMDFAALHSGVYLLAIFNEEGIQSTLRFVKQ
jgi:hypothetical protein